MNSHAKWQPASSKGSASNGKKTNGLEWTTCICSTLLCSVLAISEKAAHESDLLIRMQVWFQDSASLHLSISRQCSSVVYATEMKYHLFCIVYQ